MTSVKSVFSFLFVNNCRHSDGEKFWGCIWQIYCS